MKRAFAVALLLLSFASAVFAEGGGGAPPTLSNNSPMGQGKP
jgi:hypothetical protein